MTRLKVIEGGKPVTDRFEALIGQHYPLLFRAAYRFTRSIHDAEDLVQEVCVRAFPRLDELETLDQPHSWLLCVMRRLFIDQLRRFERSHVDSMESHDEGVFVADDPEPSEEADDALRARLLDRAWQELDRDQRSLLALHDIEGYSLAEIMLMTGLKEGTLKSRLHRARAKLGKLIRQQQEGPFLETRAGGSR
ncbi:MAG TPA: RNA polymerase sigma factor [Gammaproteobacteria bacterium]|nr:RNA polymerase sigma factor [Gammaproteobacteria bacterium]